MVLLSAQNSDGYINKIVLALFEIYRNMESLSVSNFDALMPYISNVRNFENKAK